MGREEDAKKNDIHKHGSVRQLRGPFSGQLESTLGFLYSFQRIRESA